MPIIPPAATSVRVKATSSGLGDGSPLGWLCARTIDAALDQDSGPEHFARMRGGTIKRAAADFVICNHAKFGGKAEDREDLRWFVLEQFHQIGCSIRRIAQEPAHRQRLAFSISPHAVSNGEFPKSCRVRLHGVSSVCACPVFLRGLRNPARTHGGHERRDGPERESLLAADVTGCAWHGRRSRFTAASDSRLQVLGDGPSRSGQRTDAETTRDTRARSEKTEAHLDERWPGSRWESAGVGER